MSAASPSLNERRRPHETEPRRPRPDASIRVERPRAMAEAILVLCDMWINPLLRPASPEEVRERCAAFAAIMRALGLDIFDEEMTRACVEFAAWRAQSAQ